jgi:O-antigen/teichoic acid export membrane protein
MNAVLHHTAQRTALDPPTASRRAFRSLAWFRNALAGNHLLRSSIFLTAASAVTAGLGFVFWTVVARLFVPAQVGVATSLISTISLISYLSLFGLNSTVVRFFSTSPRKNAFATQAIVGVTVSSLVLGLLAYLLLVPGREEMSGVRSFPWFPVIFLASCVFAAVNLLSDSFFIAMRRSQYNVLTDGVVQGLTKLALPVALVTLGSVGILLSTSVAALLAGAVSLILARRVLGLRVHASTKRTEVVTRLRYSGGAYVANVFYLLPILLVPLIVLDQLGPAAAGYYYIAYQVSNLLNAIGTAVGESTLAEGSYAEAEYRHLLRRSALLLSVTVVPAALLLALVSGVVMRVFGPAYVANATTLLQLLAINAVFVAIITWANFALKIVGRLKTLLVANVVYFVLMLGLSALVVRHGLVWAGLAWVASGLVVSTFLVVVTIRSARVGAPCISAGTEEDRS